MSHADALRIEGARQNNLKNISLEIPHDRLTVVTGVSGSGKSSLAFDTLFAEGQWRYIESLSTYARMFLDRVDRPVVDAVLDLAQAPPADLAGAREIGVILDRVVLDAAQHRRLRESVAAALREGGGCVDVYVAQDPV